MLLAVWWVLAFLAAATAAALVLAVRPSVPAVGLPDAPAFVAEARAAAIGLARTTVVLQAREDLRERARSVRTHDRAGFLGSVAPSARASQLAAFHRLTVVPFDRYTFVGGEPGRVGVAALSAGRAVVPVHLVSRLAGDAVTSRVVARARFALVGARWRLLDVTPVHPEIWDLARVAVAHGRRSLVLAATSDADADRLAELADEAVAAVDRTWPLRWPAHVVVVVPRTSRELIRLVGEPGSASLAGVTSFRGFRTGSVVRVQLNPAVFPGLVPLAQQILLRHEITHAAQYGRPDDRAPVWLAEGTAEYLGYLGSGVPDSVVAPSLLADAAAGRLPRDVPRAADFSFTGGGPSRRVAYEQAWTACRMVADRYGQQALFALYRDAAQGEGPAGRRQRSAVREVLGIPYVTFVQQWQDWLRSRS